MQRPAALLLSLALVWPVTHAQQVRCRLVLRHIFDKQRCTGYASS